MEGVNKMDRNESEVGDVEMAGETTAAAAISGPDHQKPVGADTMVKVSVAPEPEPSKDDKAGQGP